MLSDFNVMTNIAVKNIDESKKFYGETLGLEVVKTDGYGVTYSSGDRGGQLYVYPAPTAGTSKATIATWEVVDIEAIVDKLETAGAKFEHYDFPGAEHDGHVHIMGGMKSAWFRDPSSNILGLVESEELDKQEKRINESN